MLETRISQLCIRMILLVMTAFLAGCATQADSIYYGKTTAPKENVLRYISGSEPESLDPPIPNGQPEARILMALYDSLIEYDPYTVEPIPSGAVSWKISEDGTEYTFNLREGAKFSDGAPITANDYVFSFRRAFSPELASRNASLGYYILYSEAYNAGQSFVKNPDGTYVMKPDVAGEKKSEADMAASAKQPERLTVPTDAKAQAKLLESDPQLKAVIAGKELVPVTAEDIGVEALDDHTVKIKLYQPAPYFLGLLGHQFFRVVPKHIVEKFGDQWTRPENIVTSGSFKLETHRPYDELIVVKDPQHWDAANVKLDRIEFYPLDEQTTMLNLYQAGEVDALYNHTVPSAWFETISKYKAEYMLEPENATEFYAISVKKKPMDDLKVREAFALAVDRDAWTAMKKTYKPLIDIVPFGIFPSYEKAREKVYSELLAKQGSSLNEWKARKFDAEKARNLMGEAGFPVQKDGDVWSCPKFPVELVSLVYNTSESNKATAEFVQAQWKQNLGITVPLQNMEFKTFLPMVNKVEYSGFARRGWSGDYMDPYTFLYLYYSAQNASATGWYDPKYDRMIDEANSIIDEQKRYEKLAEAEFYVAQQQVVLPLGVPGTSWMKKPYVKGMYPNPGTLHAWKFVYIERDPVKWDTDSSTILTVRDPAVDVQINALKATQEQFVSSQRSAETGTP